MNKIAFFLTVSIFLTFTACKSDQQPLLPKVTGKPGEVLLVIDQYVWESEIGEFLNSMLTQPFEAIPQEEPIYDPVRISSSGFNNIFKSHRNIILTKISSRNKKPRIIVQRDIWAKPQLVINIIGPNDSTTVEYLEENQDKLVSLLNQAEISRTIENYKKNQAKGIAEQLKIKHNLSISVPMGYELAVDSPGFIWLAHELSDLTQAVLIYYYDYEDPNTFTPEYLVKKRNEITRQYVPGPVEGSYMITESMYPVDYKEYNKDDRYYIELRGLWKLEKAFMGGPYVSITTLDEKRNRVVTADGFVYAPSHDKRNYVREIEAIIHTLTITE
jgi:hypothetical protein